MKNPIKPLGHNIVLLYPEAKQVSDTGIILPDDAKEAPMYSEVVAVGSATSNIYPGQKLIYKPFNYTKVTFDGTSYVILPESDILAILEDD